MKREKVKFVILRHQRENRPTHYDLMIDFCGKPAKLATFSVFASPTELLAKKTAKCKRIFDHNRKFITYQGEVNKGEGFVERVDEGLAEIICPESLEFNLKGRILNGYVKISDEKICFEDSQR